MPRRYHRRVSTSARAFPRYRASGRENRRIIAGSLSARAGTSRPRLPDDSGDRRNHPEPESAERTPRSTPRREIRRKRRSMILSTTHLLLLDGQRGCHFGFNAPTCPRRCVPAVRVSSLVITCRVRTPRALVRESEHYSVGAVSGRVAPRGLSARPSVRSHSLTRSLSLLRRD